MALEAGIVGLPGAGKTTLFKALTRAAGGEYGPGAFRLSSA
jgi:ribosome-binding ATPase YchF (GTP1/OBG family)